MVKVCNATGWKVYGKAAGEEYEFRPFEEKEVYDIWHANHLLQTLKPMGIVSLEYGPKAREQYPDYTEYKVNQIIAGLTAVKKTLEEALNNEKQALREAEAHGTTADVEKIGVSQFERRLKQVEKWIDQAEVYKRKKIKARPKAADEGAKSEGAEISVAGPADFGLDDSASEPEVLNEPLRDEKKDEAVA